MGSLLMDRWLSGEGGLYYAELRPGVLFSAAPFVAVDFWNTDASPVTLNNVWLFCSQGSEPLAVGGFAEPPLVADAQRGETASGSPLPLAASVTIGALLFGAGGLYMMKLSRG